MTLSRHIPLPAIILGVWATWSAPTCLAAAAAAAADDDAQFRAAVEPLVSEYCVDCHGADEPEGDFRLEGLTGDMRAEAYQWAAVLERLQAGDMPPQGKARPDEAAACAAADWVRTRLATHPPTQPAPSPIKPVDGNRVPHALLFGTAAVETVPPPPRLWRMRPTGYSDGLVDALRGAYHGRGELAQPFDLLAEPGIRDYAELYRIDGPGTEVLLRNAAIIVEAQTNHEIRFDDEAGPDGRVSMSHDTVGEFKPLLHPKILPTREELEAAIRRQYELALVREPTADEVAGLLALYDRGREVADPVSAAKTMLMAPLLSAEAVHRFELGRGAEVRPGVRMLSPMEIAFAVNSALADRRDQVLFEAARKGELTTPEEVAAHVRRMLADEKFRKPRVIGFFREYFGYDRAPDVFKDKPEDVLHRPEQMVKDTDMLVLYLLNEDKDVFRQLLTTRKAFVNCGEERDERTGELIRYKRAEEAHPNNDAGRKHPEAAYGFDDWPAQQPAERPDDRIGILMQPSWLVARSGNFDNDPVRRGRWVRERLLGGRVPDLPLGVAAQVPDDPHRTLRDRLTLTRDNACWKCHQKMDELGLPFEAFDHYGKPRTAELVLDPEATAKNVDKDGKPKGDVRRGAPLVAAGEVAFTGDAALDGPVKDAAEMVRRIADSDRARQVFIRHLFRYVMGRNESAGDAKTLQDADRAYLGSGGSFKELLVSLICSESFLCRTVPAPAAASTQLTPEAGEVKAASAGQ